MRIVTIILLLTTASPLLAGNQTAPRFEVFPPEVSLETARDAQSLVVRIVDAGGVARDVTKDAVITINNPQVAKVERNVIKPLADGVAQIDVKYQEHVAGVPLRVRDGKTDRPISFKLDVMPIFMYAGCNSGGCHGAARGKDGFNLSLFGFDPDGDYQRLTREQATRRINLALPHESLMLTKATGKVAHTGGTRFKEDSDSYKTVVRWLESGAPSDPPTVATPVSVDIYPKQMVLEGEGATHQLTVRAKYSDGTDRDVTGIALFMSNNDTSAAVNEFGRITAGKRGEAFVMARFATFTVGAQAIVIPKDLKYSFPTVTENNYIDTHVNEKLRKLRIVPSELCSDEVFLRRACIDIIGQLPTKEQYDAFVASTDPKKREKLVDELLERKEFVEMWVMKWAELLQIRSDNQGRMSYKSTLLYYNWLQDKIASNTPFDKIVKELLNATGGTFANPATNYYQVENETLKLAENTAQVFMGMRIQCAQCHNHPFDRWTMDDYYGFASFFAQVGRKRGEDPRETIVANRGGGEVNHFLKKKPEKPKFLGGDSPDMKGQDRRAVLAEWLASRDNPYFARNLANVVWAHFLGTGIIDPVDDVRISNPATNPELLDALAAKFTEYNYDFKRLVRDICTSRTYQLSTQTNETNAADDRNFSHAAIRRVRAEVLLDCITQVTETKDKFRGLPAGARAVQIADGRTSSYFLTTFGRATRDTVCSCEVKMEPNLSQALHLINGRTIQEKLQQGNVVKKLLDAKKTPDQVVEELYQRCYARKPTSPELEKLKPFLATEPKEQQKVLEDVFWALLNSQEFIFNH